MITMPWFNALAPSRGIIPLRMDGLYTIHLIANTTFAPNGVTNNT